MRSPRFRSLLEWCQEAHEAELKGNGLLSADAVRKAQSVAYWVFVDLHTLLCAVDDTEGPLRFVNSQIRGMGDDDLLRGLDYMLRAELLEHSGHCDLEGRYSAMFELIDGLRAADAEAA